jgi:hypothetical protein
VALVGVKEVNPISGRRPARRSEPILFDHFALLAPIGMDRPNGLCSIFQNRQNRQKVRRWRPVKTMEPSKAAQMYALGTSCHSIHYPEASFVLPGHCDLTAVGRPA